MSTDLIERRRSRFASVILAIRDSIFGEFFGEELQGAVEGLAVLPEVGPEVADFDDAVIEISQSELFGGDIGGELFGR